MKNVRNTANMSDAIGIKYSENCTKQQFACQMQSECTVKTIQYTVYRSAAIKKYSENSGQLSSKCTIRIVQNSSLQARNNRKVQNSSLHVNCNLNVQ